MIKTQSKSHGWTSAEQLRQQVQRLWDRGDLLRAVLAGMTPDDDVSVAQVSLVFPLRLRLKRPTSRDIGDHFSDVRSWIQSLSNLRYTRLELVETRHPQLGRNSVPHSLWVDSLDDALSCIGKRDASRQFIVLVHELVTHDIRLIDWVRKRPVKVLELAPVWDRLLRVHDRIVQRHDAAIYLRQLSVAGVDTKFIEAHRVTLTEWLDLTFPTSSIEADHHGSRGFVRRYGFKDKPPRLRLRSLDRQEPLLARVGASECDTEGAVATAVATADVTLDVDLIRLLDPRHSCVVITENEINYLVLPHRLATLAIFGSGYGLQSLGEIDWLRQRDVWYWGDIDTHGFAILNELRSWLPNVRSLLMDRDTLMKHETLWGQESTPASRKLEHLTDEEAALYRDLVEHRYADRVRLEQEQIDYTYMLSRLDAISS